MTTREIWDDADAVAFRPRGGRRRFRHFPRELVADDARIVQERVGAFENVKVRPADASPADAHENLVRAGLGHRSLGDNQPAWLDTFESAHFHPFFGSRLLWTSGNAVRKSICFSLAWS